MPETTSGVLPKQLPEGLYATSASTAVPQTNDSGANPLLGCAELHAGARRHADDLVAEGCVRLLHCRCDFKFSGCHRILVSDF